MAKGPSPRSPRPERPELLPSDVHWRDNVTPTGTSEPPCARSRTATVVLTEPLAEPLPVVAVAIGGAVRLVSEGTVRATLSTGLGELIIGCMAEGWRYGGTLVPRTETTGEAILEARQLL